MVDFKCDAKKKYPEICINGWSCVCYPCIESSTALSDNDIPLVYLGSILYRFYTVLNRIHLKYLILY